MRLWTLWLFVLLSSSSTRTRIRTRRQTSGFFLVGAKEDEARSVEVRNESGQFVEVYWIHPQTNEMRIVSTPRVVSHGGSFRINSFVGHSFQVRQVGSANGGEGECSNDSDDDKDDEDSSTCRIANFRVGMEDDQALVVQRGFFLKRTNHASLFKVDSVSECQAQALQRQEGGSIPIEENLESLSRCMEDSLAHDMEKLAEEMAFCAQVRTEMAHLLENYTCADHHLASSPATETREWIHNAGGGGGEGEEDGVRRSVRVLLERPASRIHVIDNFISQEECRAMEIAAEPLLRPATVSNGSGGRMLSDERRALQADIRVPWEEEKEGNPIVSLSRRVYDYANHVLHLDINEFGQEDLMSIQYFGRTSNDTTTTNTKPPDQYMPHCDGDCTGRAFQPGNRIGTMVMYCRIPQRGGATRFGNAGVHVVPQEGMATFFSYIHPETQVMDKGFTRHSGCPVWEGEKKIVTQWIRLGVDKDTSWRSFNSLGVKISDDDEDEYNDDDDDDDYKDDDEVVDGDDDDDDNQ